MGLLLAAAVAAPVEAADAPPASAPTPEAQLNDLVAEYTIRFQFGTVTQALPVAERALAMAEQILGPDHERVAQILNDLGYFHQSEKNYAKALPLHQRALKIREKVFHGEGPAVVQSLMNLAKSYAGKKQYSHAQPLFERALAITEKNVQPTDRFLIGILEPYAATLRARRDTKAAYQVEMRIKQIHAAQPGAVTSIDDVLR